MKTILLYVYVFFITIYACGEKSIQNIRSKDFILLESSLQNWVAGTPSGGSGTEYYFKLRINTSKELIFDKAWINNESFEMIVTKERSSISNEAIVFTKGDTITLRVSNLKNEKKTVSIPPIIYHGDALISYKRKNKDAFFTIKEIKTIDTYNHP